MKKEILEYFKSLAKEKQEILIKDLVEHLSGNYDVSTIQECKKEEVTKSGITCPYCSSNSIIGHGVNSHSKRYRCKDCGKTFSALTGTVAHKLHKKDLLKEYLFYMLQGYSLRRITNEMDICLKTAFDWRHKVLNGINPSSKRKLDGIIEADETFFLYSEKGNKSLSRKPRKRGGKAGKQGVHNDHVAVLTAFERKTGKSMNTVVCRGRITKKAIQKGIGQWMDKKSGILCSDAHLNYQRFARDFNITHKFTFVRRKEYVVEGIYHIQNVNYLHSKLKEWIKPFNGVATKYLQNYMNYFNLVISTQKEINQSTQMLKKIIERNGVYIQRDTICQLNCIT